MPEVLERAGPPAVPVALLVPMYAQLDVANITGAPTTTVHRWAHGSADGPIRDRPLIGGVQPGRGLTVPFLGLAQAFVLWSFRRAGVPLQRIRPAVDVLERELSLEFALASNRLVTDGAEILWRAAPGSDDPRLIVVRNGQAAFNEIVEGYLRHIRFDGDYAEALSLPRFDRVRVTVDPRVNGGRPTLAEHGIAVEDVLGRLRAGETVAEVAADFELGQADVHSLLYQAA